MCKATHRSRGFTLIASLLLLVLLSAIAAGLMYTVNGSGHVGSNDLESNTAYYGAESGMEKLTSDLLSLYQQKLSPTQTDLNLLAKSSPPSAAQVPGMTYLESVNWTNVDAKGNPVTTTNVVSQGAYAGLTAEIIPLTLQVSAMRPFGATVNMTRGVEIALIPVFQFGVFSDSDLSYFAGPPFAFLGRVHSNGNLYLNADSGPLVLGDKVTVAGNILRDRLANNYLANKANGYFGDVYLANGPNACDTYAAAIMPGGKGGNPPANCVNWGPDTDRSTDDSSWSQGIPTANGYQNSISFTGNISPNHFQNQAMIGVTPLQLPFVSGTAVGSADTQIEIIREQETTAELPSSPIGASREYNKANIRILLADTQAQLHPDGRPNDNVNDIDLTAGGACATPLGLAWAVTGVGTTRFAMATTGLAHEPNWKGAPTGTACNPWNLVDGWLRVEYCNSTDCSTAANWIGATKEWLNFGFARDVTPPTQPIDQTVVGKVSGTAGTNQTHPDAILIFQQRADRNATGTISASPGNDDPSNIVDGASKSQNSWYPINFFDPREGFPRDVTPLAGTQCYVNGIMNAVELDVGNFAKWVAGTGPYGGGTGKNVNTGPQNGYLVYFSDRRGELPNPNGTPANVQNGESGLEDVINSGSATGTPDGKLEANTPGYNFGSKFSPEDVDQDGVLDQWGAVNIGNGFGAFGISTTDKNPYKAIDCVNGGRQNKVTGARHVLRLVDGALSNVPLPGFTIAAENPVYVLGDYNSNSADTVWTTGVDKVHSASAVIADAVTLLSNDWTDLNDLSNPNNLAGRAPTRDTSFRLAIASGKNMNFPQPAGFGNDFGTDGGVHNFLRYIENLGNITLNYRGSMVSMYYSEYATGIFKCCSLVYSPPTRNYSFDKDFLVPTNLPPGTPMLQDIDTLSYWQNFNPCTTQTAKGSCSN